MTELLNRPHAVTAAAAERVFGRSRLRMATGTHVDVFREASRPGERRRYTKRFLATPNGDYRRWTEREWRLLALLVGHGVVAVPEIVRFDRGVDGEPALIQTYDAGVTVDHWATLLPVRRGGRALRHAFEDAPHWFALARHALAALDAVHALALVHLDLKADNVCIPAAPTGFDPHEGDGAVRLEVASLALIDFAFALVSGERLATALPIARQPDYDYQSPRLLAALEHGLRGDLGPTRELDWRCDFYSLAAMLERYLPPIGARVAGDWTASALGEARRLVAELRVIHDGALPRCGRTRGSSNASTRDSPIRRGPRPSPRASRSRSRRAMPMQASTPATPATRVRRR
jgi:serine/threonine protein kinase